MLQRLSSIVAVILLLFPAASHAVEHVIILHGLSRTSYSMNRVADKLRSEGYEVDNLRYYSTRDNLPTIIEKLHRKTRYYTEKDEKVHFVCHSFGCLVTRGMIHQYRPKNLGKVVMLGPPNQGSEMADYFENNALAHWILGNNLPQMGTRNRRTLANMIGVNAEDYELGIIAGDDTIYPIASQIIPNEDDGRVPVERTVLPGMKEQLVVHVTHPSLITNDKVIEQTAYFLKNGNFNRKIDVLP